MNIKRELKKAQFRKDLENRFKKAIAVIKRYICQHKDCASEIISVTLGNTEDSIIAELVGKENAKLVHNMKLRRVYCLNCGREIYREVISMEDPKENSGEQAS